MSIFKRLIGWYGKRVVYGTMALLVVFIAVGAYFVATRQKDADVAVEAKKQVEVGPAGSLSGTDVSLRTVGSVRAISEARLQTETGGRVTAVNVGIGDHVSAGQVLASIENSRERAALLSAEGAYEGVHSANAQSSIGLSQVETGADNAYRSAYATADDAVHNVADELFSDANGANPGIRIDAKGQAPRLSIARVQIGALLNAWTIAIQRGSLGDKKDMLDQAERDLTTISDFVSEISNLLADADPDSEFTPAILAADRAKFAGARASVNGALSAVSGARTALLSAQQSVNGGAVSSDTAAREKQALGALRAAQSQYEKTLVRTPISGVVNALYLHANEYAGQNAPAAVVANNNALEITTSVSEGERSLISVGDKVKINDTVDGAITRIAPAIDPATGKIEVKVSVVDEKIKLENGTTVSLSLSGTGGTQTSSELRVPIRALKITSAGPIAFTVKADNTLEAHAVTLGAVVGDMVVVKDGISSSTPIVSDARGLKEGEVVEIITK